MKIAFLINHAYGIGGTIRTTMNLSEALAESHEVEIASVHRTQDKPALAIDERVTLTPLIDLRKESPTNERGHELMGQPSTMFPYPDAVERPGRVSYTALHDERIEGWLRETDADVVIATRPDLNGYLVRSGQARCVRIGQEHLSRAHLSPTVREHQNRAVRELDAFVTVSQKDAADYRAANPDAAARVFSIPNGVPRPAVAPSTLDSKVVVAAGRLVGVKRYDRLIDAFAHIADANPAWTLRIYGIGTAEPRLRRRIKRLGLYDRVFLMGAVSPIETEWAKGAIAAVSSDFESFGMTIVEAMHCGVPVVATDCPHGPAEIITHERDGLLVPLDSGVEGYAHALDRLMNDTGLRTSLATAARVRAGDYAPHSIVRQYEELFRELGATRPAQEREATTSTTSSGVRAAEQPSPAPGSKSRGSLWTRLRSALPARTASSQADVPTPDDEAGARPSRPAPRPTARVAATPDGGIDVCLDPATLPAGPVDLVACLRYDTKGRDLRIPLTEAAVDPDTGFLRIRLDPAEHDLPEGRWDCYIEPRQAGGRRRRLACALAEQARCVGREPQFHGGRVTAWIPYAAGDRSLSVRVWQRTEHAEVTRCRIDGEEATVTARLFAADHDGLPADATVVAVSRHDASHDITLPVRGLGPGDGHFTFTVPYAAALALRAGEHDVWDLRLQLGDARAPVPIGRIGGDIVDRKKTDTYPGARMTHPERGRTRARPFFTVNNDLALSLRDVTA